MIPDFLLKIVGRRIGDKIKLQENSTMENKKWFQSKTVWTAVVGGLLSIYTAIGTIHPLPVIPEWIYTLLGAIGLYGLRTADSKIS